MTRTSGRFAAACIILAAAAMFPALRNGFTTWDDPQYVLDNPLVRSVSPGAVVTIFSTPEVAGNYHPVTVTAIALQYAAFGTSPFGYHLVSLLLHLFSTLLVFRIATALGAPEVASFAAAALFGVHPLHLEPVAWIADQKDLLATVFSLAAIFVYLTNEGGKKRIMTVVLPLFVLAVLSKATAVVLPLILLLIDYYRERRFRASAMREKLAFFAVAVGAGLLALRAQSAAGAIAAAEIDTPVEKFLYACGGYVTYLAKLVVPFGLSPWYPYPVEPPLYFWVFPPIAAGVIVAAIAFRKKAPIVFLAVGWYTVAVAPVLQFVQVGNAMMAERYAYFSSIGLLLAAGIAFDRVLKRSSTAPSKRMPVILGGAYLVTLTVCTMILTSVWRDGVTLWTRVIEAYPTSAKGWFNRGHALHNAGQYPAAIADYDRTLALAPGYPFAQSNRGLSRLFSGDRARALADFDAELRMRPGDTDVRFWRASIVASLGRYDEALAELDAVLAAKPGNFEATVRRGLIYTATREYAKAEADFDAAIAAKPSQPNLYFNRANVRAGMERWNDAIADYSTVLRMSPADRDAFYARGIAHFMGRDTASACADLRRASTLGSAAADTAIAEICVQ